MMTYNDYTAVVEFDPEIEAFHGRVLNTRDVISFEGRSVDELRTAFEEAVEDYLEWCAEEGREPERPYSGRFMLRISAELHKRAAVAAEASGKSLNAFVAEAIESQTRPVVGR